MLKLGNDRKGEANPLSLLNGRILLAAIRYVQSQDFKGEKERDTHTQEERWNRSCGNGAQLPCNPCCLTKTPGDDHWSEWRTVEQGLQGNSRQTVSSLFPATDILQEGQKKSLVCYLVAIGVYTCKHILMLILLSFPVEGCSTVLQLSGTVSR